MEFRVAIATHIGNMNVADAIVRGFVHCTTITLNPFAIASRHFTTQSLHHDDPCLFRLGGLDKQLNLIPGLIDEQFLWTSRGTDTLPIDRQDRVPYLDV